MSPPFSSQASDKCADWGLRIFHKDTLLACRRPMGVNATSASQEDVKSSIKVTEGINLLLYDGA